MMRAPRAPRAPRARPGARLLLRLREAAALDPLRGPLERARERALAERREDAAAGAAGDEVELGGLEGLELGGRGLGGHGAHHRRPMRFEMLMTGPPAAGAATAVPAATTVGACGRLNAIIIAIGRSRSFELLDFWLARSLIELCTDVSVVESWSFFETPPATVESSWVSMVFI